MTESNVDSVTSRPHHGKQLLVNLVDQIARTDPHREFLWVPLSSNPKDGWKELTFEDFANAVNSSAHRIVDTVGRVPLNSFPTIAYIGHNDVRYLVVMFAAVKAGYKVLFISPRNSQEGQLSLFEKTDCNIIAFPLSHKSVVQPWLEERDMRTIVVRSVESIFAEDSSSHFPYDKPFEEAEWDPLVVLHTSGSTGTPKPIICRQGMLAVGDSYHTLPEWKGKTIFLRRWIELTKRLYNPSKPQPAERYITDAANHSSVPLFHSATLYSVVLTSIYWGVTTVLGIADRPLFSGLVIESLKDLDVDSALLPPSIIEELSKTEDGIQALKKLNVVTFGGGKSLILASRSP